MRMDEIRSHFPYFNSPQNKDSIYFDNAATTQKPQVVIDEIVNYYQLKSLLSKKLSRRMHSTSTESKYSLPFSKDESANSPFK